ncbi:putative histidine kinase response regulator and transcription factor RR-A-type family [Lupinus albus]|uniref:Putative histidine kinase response regulator and transcription factor RR-A-type family n=1 Tax=Lupinus albus TaxID=3870 RepID=A0A6A4NDI9_LUPAL|nr:putative histidine kinase response regulator and transcription factor RR-A-type family [Lupinus albus]
MEAQNKGKGLMAPQDLTTNLTALVVDDNKLTRMLHQRLLNKAGVKNHAVENGKEAVDIHCSAQSFDMILMDKDMPIMNGIEATKKLRSMGIGSMIVGVSSSSKEEEIREFMEAGLNDYKVKPFTFTMLSSIIDKINSSKSNNSSNGCKNN